MSQHLLIIQDDSRLANMVAQYLQQSGYSVSQAGDGASGLSRLSAPAPGLAPDLVILDLMLPDMDGLEVCRRIRALPGGASANTGPHADGQGRPDGPHHRPGNGCRRLPAQTL